MALTIPEHLRIRNKNPVPKDETRTRKDAELIMEIFDAIVNGDVRMRVVKIYPTYNDMVSEEGEVGMLAYTEDTDQYYAWKKSTNSWQLAF